MIHRALVFLHRWTGLLMAAFLALIGLTGSVLAYNTELERVFAPQLFAHPHPNTRPLDVGTLAACAQALLPQARVRGVVYIQPDQVQVYFEPKINPSTGRLFQLGFDEFFLDPWSGRELGRRRRGDLREGRINVMPFIYEVHWTLALGEVGHWFFGILALLWSLDCFAGFYLTLPQRAGPFWSRWKFAWRVKWSARASRINFDMHRAAGLWLWVMLFVLAWSSVMMNLRPVYERVMRSVSDYHSFDDEFPPTPAERNEHPVLDWHTAAIIGQKLITEEASSNGFSVREPLGLWYSPDSGTYTYEVRSSRDVFERAPKGGITAVTLDGNSGAFRSLFRPTGEHLGNTMESWLYALHMARVFCKPYQLFVCFLGLVVAVLSVSGVCIWRKKLNGRKQAVLAKTRVPSDVAVPGINF